MSTQFSHAPCALQEDTKALFQQLIASQSALKQADVQVCILEEQIVTLNQVRWHLAHPPAVTPPRACLASQHVQRCAASHSTVCSTHSM
jgi:hypothetical protein